MTLTVRDVVTYWLGREYEARLAGHGEDAAFARCRRRELARMEYDDRVPEPRSGYDAARRAR